MPENDSTNSAQSSPTQSPIEEFQNDVLQTELALSSLDALGEVAAYDAEHALIKEFQLGNLNLWKARAEKFGLDKSAGAAAPPSGDDMAQTVKIRSPENHYHLPATPAAGLPNWLKTAALLGGSAGLAGLGAAGYQLLKPPAAIGAPGKIGLQPGGVTIEIVKDPITSTP